MLKYDLFINLVKDVFKNVVKKILNAAVVL